MSADPLRFVGELDAVMEACCRRCPHCRARVELTRGGAGRMVLGETHEPGCPEHVPDDEPAAEYDTDELARIYGEDAIS